MRKIIFLLVLNLFLFTGCKDKIEEKENVSNVGQVDSENDIDIGIPNEDEDSKSISLEQLKYVSTEGEIWSQELIENKKLEQDIDGDGVLDLIQIDLEEVEGRQQIKSFEVGFGSLKESFILNNYDASFIKMDESDLDSDGLKEFIFLFDTHGNGGQGTHDVIILKKGDKKIVDFNLSDKLHDNDFKYSVSFIEDKKIVLLNKENEVMFEMNITNDYYDYLYDESNLYEKVRGGVDQIYDYQIVEADGVSKLMVKQYVWGDGHNDGLCDLVSIINFAEEPYKADIKLIDLNYKDFVERIN